MSSSPMSNANAKLPSAAEEALRVYLRSQKHKGASVSNAMAASLASKTARNGMPEALRATIKRSAMAIALDVQDQHIAQAKYETAVSIGNIFRHPSLGRSYGLVTVFLVYVLATVSSADALLLKRFGALVANLLRIPEAVNGTARRRAERAAAESLRQALDHPSAEWRGYIDAFRRVLTDPLLPKRLHEQFSTILGYPTGMVRLIELLPESVNVYMRSLAEPDALERARHRGRIRQLGYLIQRYGDLFALERENEAKDHRNGYEGQFELAMQNIQKLMAKYRLKGDPETSLEDVVQAAKKNGILMAKDSDAILAVYRWRAPPMLDMDLDT